MGDRDDRSPPDQRPLGRDRRTSARLAGPVAVVHRARHSLGRPGSHRLRIRSRPLGELVPRPVRPGLVALRVSLRPWERVELRPEELRLVRPLISRCVRWANVTDADINRGWSEYPILRPGREPQAQAGRLRRGAVDVPTRAQDGRGRAALAVARLAFRTRHVRAAVPLPRKWDATGGSLSTRQQLGVSRPRSQAHKSVPEVPYDDEWRDDASKIRWGGRSGGQEVPGGVPEPRSRNTC